MLFLLLSLACPEQADPGPHLLVQAALAASQDCRQVHDSLRSRHLLLRRPHRTPARPQGYGPQDRLVGLHVHLSGRA